MANKTAMVVGGASGVGAATVLKLLTEGYKKVYIVDRVKPEEQPANTEFVTMNLVSDSPAILKDYDDIDTLVITAGVGRMDYFSTFSDVEIENAFRINAISAIEIIKVFYNKINSNSDFYCAVMSSICGIVSSPLYAIYAATKAAVSRFVESVNSELDGVGVKNRILCVAPGSIKGTRFHGSDKNDFSLIMPLTNEIYTRMLNRDTEFVPNGEVYDGVISRYRANAQQFGLESYNYKLEKNNLETKPRIKVGYLTGTFDLFHIGHLNLLRRAKQYCDYLVVGVHKDGSHKGKELFIPLEERLAIVESVKYVDRAMVCTSEDIDAYEEVKFDYLFVGSDYQGTERFNRYEKLLGPKGVKIVYFPYTKGTSSTQLRANLSK